MGRLTEVSPLVHQRVRMAFKRLNAVGLLVATFFFAMSLTPSLLPRTDSVQGMISGISLTAGYGVGLLGYFAWRYLQLPVPGKKVTRLAQAAAAVICLLFAIVFLWQALSWQNSVRALMGMDEVAAVHHLFVGVIAFSVFVALLALGRACRSSFLHLSRLLQRFIPPRVSHLAGLLLVLAFFWSAADGMLFRLALRGADNSYQRIDTLMDPDIERPTAPLKPGSSESLLAWDNLGRQGRRFVASGPDATAIESITGGESREPLRVYVGLNSAPTPEERARLALEELIRTDAFERSILLLITPTGTGWIDPAAINPAEYLHRGDIASVAVQYSYLPSPLSLMSEGEYGTDTARALFQELYGYWSELPTDQRPDLYLHGVSLGALNSDLSFDFFDIIDDPFDGAFWAGPPFRSPTWQSVTERREPGSPAWLPRFRGGSVVRFANQNGGFQRPDSAWGSFRIGFLQYASDPVTFFDPESFYREPDWVRPPRGPDVSPDLQWFPIVTMLQLMADMAFGASPTGYGHEYATTDYLDGWLALTEPPGWDPSSLARLRTHIAHEQL